MISECLENINIYIHIYGYVSEWIHDFDAELHLSYTQQSISKRQHTI